MAPASYTDKELSTHPLVSSSGRLATQSIRSVHSVSPSGQATRLWRGVLSGRASDKMIGSRERKEPSRGAEQLLLTVGCLFTPGAHVIALD